MTNVSIRTATIADVPAMHAIRLAVRENRLSDPARITEASYLPYVDAGSVQVAIDAAGRVVGFAAIDRGAGSVWALFVDPAAEGQGVGRALHDAMIARAAREGIARLWLSTATGTRAEQFYLRAGWRKGVARNAVGGAVRAHALDPKNGAPGRALKSPGRPTFYRELTSRNR